MTHWSVSRITAALLILGALAAGPASAAEDVVEVKLGMDMLSKEQQQTLWQRVERYAAMESFVNFCGRPTHIERRVVGAIQPCITPATIQQVVSRFRSHLREKNAAITAEKSVCEESRIKGLIREIHTAVDTLVNEVTRMCKSCLIC
jgi:hypothetical protein